MSRYVRQSMLAALEQIRGNEKSADHEQNDKREGIENTGPDPIPLLSSIWL